jgi:hypothetical protein
MVLIDLKKKFNEIRESVEKINFTDVKLTEEFKKEYERYLNENQPNGYSTVDFAEFSTKITTSTGKAIFITNFWFYIAAELSNYLDALSQQKNIFNEIYNDTDLHNAAVALRNGVSAEEESKITNYFSSKGYTDDDLACFLSFVSDYKSWGGGKTIDRNDYYVSPLLQAGNLLAETQSAVAEIAKQMSENLTLKKLFKPIFIPKVHKSTETLLSNLSRGYSTLSKPFILLAGISGTGKTRFVREQAKATGSLAETYCLTSVRPDWHEPSDLLGYISRLAKDGEVEYITTDVLEFIAKAWRAIADSGLTIEVQESEDQGKRLVVAGERDALDKVLPYWLCLDEMNLAPVEQYFADYLSVLETREWCWADDSFTYSSDALLKPATIEKVEDKDKLRKALGFDGAQYDELWVHICQYGLGIPFNLLVAGTVNMDETTHGFSRKVIDRALSFDFGAFFPNDYNDFFTPTSCNKRLSYPIWSHASKADLANTYDADGAKTVAFLSAVNAVLKNTPFELAFRALNELLLAVFSSQPKDKLTLQAVWDDFMMCKVLPRIEGDIDKLTTTDGKTLLAKLDEVLAKQLNLIWLAPATDEANQRPDLYREKIVADGATDEEKVLHIPCRSKAKLKWMSERLTSATFTSFWP